MMRPRALIKWILFFALSGVLAGPSAVFGESDDKSLSPYFFVKTGDDAVDRLPLKSTSVSASIAGVIADVVVTQVYQNEGKHPIEATYIFPASTRAAVYGMKMTIGERTLVAKIDKRQAARQAYEEARAAGKSASLLEQQRPHVFQMNVANIFPGDVIAVELKYTELLIPQDAVYEFVFPTVVGPRYAGASSDAGQEQWIKNPYLRQGEAPADTFAMSVSLAAGLPIQQIASTSHKVNIRYAGRTHASIALQDSEKYGGNRDFILQYALAGGRIESGMLLSRGEKENYFLLMLQPPKKSENFLLPPREYIFIVDVSGSMDGFPLDISKKLLRDLLGALTPRDRFNVLLFAGASRALSETSLPATEDNIQQAVQLINNQAGGGGTELLPALKQALSLPRVDGVSRNVVIATDGYVSVEKEAFDLIRDQLGKANVFSFGIGASVNRLLIEGMARVGMGEAFIVTKPAEAESVADKFRKLIQYPLLTDIRVDWGGFEAYDVTPAGIPDLLAHRPVIVFGKWKGTPKGSIRIEGRSGKEAYRSELKPAQFTPSENLTALSYLWARNRIAILSDYNRLQPNDERIDEVTRLGLFYSLLTDYTSFIAIDTRVRGNGEAPVQVTQPLPLPQGVSDAAVGGEGLALSKRSVALPLMAPGAPVAGRAETEMAEDKEDALPGIPYDSPEPIRRFEVESVHGFSPEAVSDLLQAHADEVAGCGQLKEGGSFVFPVKLSVVLTIAADGRVRRVEVKNSSAYPKNLVACLNKKLSDLRFPGTGNGGKATVRITLSQAP